MTRVLSILVLVLVLVLPAAAAGGGTTARASFEYGRTGGTRSPFRVYIARDGKVTSSGAIQKSTLVRRVPVRTLDRLFARARAASFFAMPKYTSCKGTLPDYAASFLRISSSARSRTVKVRGDCRPKFTQLYGAVRDATSRH
jgi:hypothetical protein